MITRRDFIKITAAGGALASMGQVSDARAAVQTVLPDESYAIESARKIPVIAEADIVVAGGSGRAVAAAIAAARTGSRVFLVGYMPYLGDDICGSFLFDKAEHERIPTALGRKLFLQKDMPTPLHVKTVLENELIDNNIDFLYSSYVTNALVDGRGKPAGVVIVNRSGRQAIRCKAVIDATHTGSVAAMFGAVFTGDKPATREYQFTVMGNTPKTSPEIIKREQLNDMKFKGKSYPVTRYTFRLPYQDDSYAELMRAEQVMREKTWDADQVDSSDLIWYIPYKTLTSEKAYTGSDTSVRKLPLSAFHPEGIENIWIIGPCAALPREVAQTVMRPIPALHLGEILGEQIAGQVKDIPMPSQATVRHSGNKGSNYGEVGELLEPLRKTRQKGSVESPAGTLPVLGSYDVIVMGGGTAGAAAGISAAKEGARTLVLDYLHGLGGITTLGMIGRYWDGFREGYSAIIDKEVKEMAPGDHPRQLKNWQDESVADWKIEWYRRQLINANADIWFGVLGCGALTEGNQVKGIVVATPMGRGVILSKIVIDSTGSADIAIAAGAGFDYTGKKTLAVQGAGMGKRDPGDFYNNNDWLFTDDTDILDVTRVYIQAKSKLTGAYDMVKIPQTRERRRVIGEYIISVYDVLNHRRYPDTISYHKSSFDTHGMIVDPYFILSPPMERHTVYDADVPLRSLLPKGLDGIITTGLGASAHRDAMPVIRMQPCLQNQGYAVGYLAAQCIKENKPIRKMDIKKIQRHLVRMGNLPGRVLTDKAFKGYNSKELQQAVLEVENNYKGLEILLTEPDKCRQFVRKQIVRTQDAEAKLVYASILCMLEDDTYSSLLSEYIKNNTWDKGWHYTGMHQFGMCLSRLDALLTSLGNSKDTASLPVILEKAKELEPEDYFSHFRAIAMATEAMGDKQAIPVLASLLTTPGMRYHVLDSYATARSRTVPDEIDVTERNKALKELHIARALYLCGDKDKLGETILKQYADGLEGHYARYASEILNL